MSGSDLDGDEYICIWKPELIFEANADPYIYDDKPLGLNPYPVWTPSIRKSLPLMIIGLTLSIVRWWTFF